MKAKEKILSAIGDIEDDFIEEAAAYAPPKKKQGSRNIRKYGGALAACLMVAVVTCAALMPAEKTPGGDPLPETKTAKLPLLTIEEKQSEAPDEKRTKKLPAASDSDVAEGRADPWTADSNVETLPVYTNQAYGTVVAAAGNSLDDEENGKTLAKAKAADRKELSDRVLMTAAAAGMEAEPSDVKISEDGSDDAAGDGSHFVAMAATEQGTVQVSLDHEALIRFTESVELPEEHRIPAGERNRENMEETAAWLLSEYSRLTGFASSRASAEAFWQEDGRKWIISGCEQKDDPQSQIVSYNLNRVFFQLDDAGNLSGILLRDYMACSEKIEEYPIIAEEEARKLLAEGEYVTKCGYDMPGTAYIRRVSLVYLAGEHYNIFMPYYAFDVQLPEGAGDGDGGGSDSAFDEGYVDCGTYYVPAVKGDYIANMPKGQTD